MIGTPSDFTQHFRVGAGWQRVVGPDGDVRLKPVWDGGALLIDQPLGFLTIIYYMIDKYIILM